ncbi:unnamed protein product [Brassica rapa subsp. narinosa]
MEALTLEFRFIFFLWSLNFTSYTFIFFLKSSLISSSTIYIYRLLWSCKAVEESRFKKKRNPPTSFTYSVIIGRLFTAWKLKWGMASEDISKLQFKSLASYNIITKVIYAVSVAIPGMNLTGVKNN